MWFSILVFPDNDKSNVSILVGRDGTLYVRATDVFQILFPGQNAWRVCNRFMYRNRNIGRSVESVLPGLPTRYPKMKVVTFQEAVDMVKDFSGGHRFAVYLLDVMMNARVAPVPQKTFFGSVVYCTNPNRASVFRVVKGDSVSRDPRLMPRVIPITELIEAARTKFMDTYKRFEPKIPSPLNSTREENELRKDDEERDDLTQQRPTLTQQQQPQQQQQQQPTLTQQQQPQQQQQQQPTLTQQQQQQQTKLAEKQRQQQQTLTQQQRQQQTKLAEKLTKLAEKQRQQQQTKLAQNVDNVFEISFPSPVPREIRWNDGRAIYTFKCVCYQTGTGDECITLRREEVEGRVEVVAEMQQVEE